MQSFDSEKGLIKFSHCKKDIFCSYVPKLCPICGQSLNYRRLEDAPVSIPSPFVNGHRQICSFLLKPTTGTFLRSQAKEDEEKAHQKQIELKAAEERDHQRQMETARIQLQIQEGKKGLLPPSENSSLLTVKDLERVCPIYRDNEDIEEFLSTFERLCDIHQVRDERRMAVLLIKLTEESGRYLIKWSPESHEGYDGSSDLHVGITNTNGLVYNYNETGIHRVELGWEQCISIPLVQPGMNGLLKQWDKYLEEFSTGETWFLHRYDEHHHNCYTYALAFINCILAAQDKQQMSKSEFTERFVIPQTRKASKYITLYQEIAENYFYIGDSPDQEKNNTEEDKLLH